MNSLNLAFSDSTTMLQRNFRRALRNPFVLFSSILTPALMLVLFFYVLGGSIAGGLNAGEKGSTEYLNYLLPGIILLTAALGAEVTALNVNYDRTENIISRFRTMPISRGALVTGHVLINVIQTLISIACIVGIGLLMGFRPSAGPVEWLAAFGLLALFSLAIAWLAVPLGLISKTPAGANSLSLIIGFLLPFFSSAFVKPDTMPDWLQVFVKYQPFTAVTETLRGLLTGTPIGDNWIYAIIGSVVLAILGYIFARWAYNRQPTR